MRTYVESLKRCFDKGEITSVKIQMMITLTDEEKEYILTEKDKEEISQNDK